MLKRKVCLFIYSLGGRREEEVWFSFAALNVITNDAFLFLCCACGDACVTEKCAAVTRLSEILSPTTNEAVLSSPSLLRRYSCTYILQWLHHNNYHNNNNYYKMDDDGENINHPS